MAKKNKQKKEIGSHSSILEQFANLGLIPQDQIEEITEKPCSKSYLHPKKCEIEKTRLPQNTQKVLSDAGPEVPDNFSLRLNRWIGFEKEKNKVKPFLPKYSHKEGFPCFDIKYVKDIADRNFSAIQDSGLKLFNIEFAVDWRLVVGLGIESVYETSMTLHHVHGFPYIPGSSVKGIVRSWVITEVFGETNDDNGLKFTDLKGAETRALDDKGFIEIFGNTEKSGKVRFFDAFPTTPPKIETDVMNPHFRDYYRDQKGKTPPADYQEPVPVSFLTVKDTSFRFILGMKEKENRIIAEDSLLDQGIVLLDVAGRWLNKALSEHGVGAKTAIGYGLMRSVHKNIKQ